MRQAAHPIRTANQATRGVTLLELLVVMLIMLMVTAAAIPIIAPAMQNRSMREATRLVTSYIGAAKARAVQSGRPVGVVIERFEPSLANGGAYAIQMAQIEVPPPYSGDVVGARLTVQDLPTGSVSANAATNFSTRFPGQTPKWFKATEPVVGMLNTKLLKVGDQIQFNGQGPHYVVLGPDTIYDGVIDDISSTLPLEFAYVYTPPLKQAFPWLNTTPAPQPATYQVFRQPVRTSTPPLQLTEGIVFDLSVSGWKYVPFNSESYGGNIGTLPVPPPRVLFDPQIIFSPSGRIELVTNGATGQLTRMTDPVAILLGRRELMFDVTSRGVAEDIVFQNLSPIPKPPNQRPAPAENFWVIVGSSGQVNTAPVAPNFQDYTNAGGSGYTTWHDVIAAADGQSLAYALEQQSQSGR